MSGKSHQISEHDRRKGLSFRQAEGREPLPKMTETGRLDRTVRKSIWDLLFSFLSYKHRISYAYSVNSFDEPARSLLIEIFSVVLKYTIDEAVELVDDTDKAKSLVKHLIMKNDYDDCLEVVQTLIQSKKCPNELKNAISRALDHPSSAYVVVHLNPPIVMPRMSEEEVETVSGDIYNINNSGFSGARVHLRQSAEQLNRGDYKGAIREAIHGVESAAKVVTGEDGATLADALRLLEREKGLHSALKSGFEKLYAYTSDEKGIRHALIDAENRNVGLDEALFMFSASVAFVSYLARKFPEHS